MTATTVDGAESPPDSFDVCAALPTGTTVLEASAGTGKTYTIAALTARYVAEGYAELGELMLITFGRMATNELRQRVRERLVGVERCLTETLDGAPPSTSPDQLELLLTDGTEAELGERHRRIARALSDFDAATIATTHEFCLRMLDELGILGDREPDVVFVEHLSELTVEVTTDVYLRRYASEDRPPPMDFEEAQRIAQQAIEAWDTRLVPAATPAASADSTDSTDSTDEGSAGEGGAAAERVDFTAEVRAEVLRRKELARLFTYDDMLTRLRDALADPVHGGAAVRRLRERYRFVLVDEFQDTDPVQWDILRRAFHGYATLVLIGDPKQAIYAFRGADVVSYLDAVSQAGRVATLSTNWRSDQPLVDALGTLLGGAALGDERIVVRPVTAHHPGSRFGSGPEHDPRLTSPVRIRIVEQDPAAERVPSVSTLRPQIVDDLVADVVELLGSGLELQLAGVRRRISPADVAILVRRNERADVLRDALVTAGVPAVVLGATSVFATPIAAEWATLLTTLEQPRPAAVRQAALTCFFGWTFSRLVAADEDAVNELTQQVRWWSRVIRTRGVATLLETITRDTRLTERLLAQVGGERLLTDLRHVAQSLHAAMTAGHLGVGALSDWLRTRIADAKAATPTEGMRRLETDAASVQILTVHRSKGLEFPIVYLPEAWDRYVNTKDAGWTLRLHEGTERVLDVGGITGPGRGARLAQYRREEDAEDLRLLYVALTRAQCQVVTWWAASKNTPASSLQRFLYGPRTAGVEPEPAYEVSGDPFSCAHLGTGISLERVTARHPAPWQSAASQPPVMTARVFDRQLDLDWRRTSYSALTAAVHGLDLSAATVDSEIEPTKEDDESTGATATDSVSALPTTDPALALPSPMGDLPSGAQFGTVVHAIFESVDLRATDLPGEVHRVTAEQLARAQPGLLSVDGLTQALLPSLQTPLGPLAHQLRLCDVDPADRLAELSFELPLAGGDVSTSDIRLGQLGGLLRASLDPDDPLARYPERLEHPGLAEESLRGYLTGSIDAVLRVRADDTSEPRYLVVDYKTNWLGDFEGGTLTVGHYTPALMAEAMMDAHYPLQALLYSVAVHRLLRWRQPGYDPDIHLGGVLYLFIRGMAGPDTPTIGEVPCGVFSWRPPGRLIADLSDLLEGR